MNLYYLVLCEIFLVSKKNTNNRYFYFPLKSGPQKYDVKITLPESEAGDALCVKHLTEAVYNLTEIPPDAQKLIYKGTYF